MTVQTLWGVPVVEVDRIDEPHGDFALLESFDTVSDLWCATLVCNRRCCFRSATGRTEQDAIDALTKSLAATGYSFRIVEGES
jgi:hypothetical protein